MRKLLGRTALRVVLACSALLPRVAVAQAPVPGPSPPLLYHAFSYGTQAAYDPLVVLGSLMFEDLQRVGVDRRLAHQPLDVSIPGTWNALRHPVASIGRYGGWGEWLSREIVPLRFGGDAAWVPNYTIHLVSGTLQARMLREWYRAQGVPAPTVWASVTLWGASFFHEAIAHPAPTAGEASTLADLAVFDVVPLLLSHHDGVGRFLARRLDAAYWPPLLSIDIPTGEVDNMGDYWIYKIPVFSDRTRLFWRLGYGTEWGLSRRFGAENALSVAFGLDTQERSNDPLTGYETVRQVFAGGVYWDRNNSLLASVHASGRYRETINVNVYPGVLPGALRPLGVWLSLGRSGAPRFGVVGHHLPGVGFAP